MAAIAPISLDVYLRSSYEPNAEYVDGAIEERPTGEYDHAAWQAAIQRWFFLHEEEWGIDAVPELRVQVSPTRCRIPDVTVLDVNRPVEQVVSAPPLAVFEILSPDDSVIRLRQKLEDYASMGISEIWVIDPADGATLKYEAKALRPEDRFVLPGRAISFSMDEIRERLRRKRPSQ
ncbi:MAG TPA: Uma2 family endonuclease [Terracidiphilus sp.]|nr:Uma2 family endonuclease [Terracidiphilus sp.]